MRPFGDQNASRRPLPPPERSTKRWGPVRRASGATRPPSATVAVRRHTNVALLGLSTIAVVSGGLMFAIGSGWNAWATLTHGAAGVAMLTLARPKTAIVRRSLHHRRLAPTTVTSAALSVLVVTAIASGFAHRAGVRHLGPVLVMQVHVGAALVAVPLLAWHVVARPLGRHETDLDRRALLTAAVGLGASAAVTMAVPAATRRRTRSLEVGTDDPPAMPVTQWLFDDVPTIDAGSWRLRVGGRPWSFADLDDAATTDVRAVLDCTGGWFAAQTWRTVPIVDLLAASGVDTAGARSLVVRSATGYERRFPVRDVDAGRLFLATAVGGRPLSPAHGAPARVVAPDRRGFWWVKWVVTVAVDDRPWFWQPPFPLR